MDSTVKMTQTPLAGLTLVESSPFADNRGTFMRCFCLPSLQEILGSRNIVQINHSRTDKAGAVRGLHLQNPPSAEMKLVRCMRGRVWDVAVDLRKGSSTFLQWHAEVLSPDNHRMLIVPEGFAHGFQVLEPASELFYLTTTAYHKPLEWGIRPDDPAIGIQWPLPVVDLSERDQAHPLLTDSFEGVAVSSANQ